jgi:antitoxin component YwqK of YwqJK toxin-antitoxin module
MRLLFLLANVFVITCFSHEIPLPAGAIEKEVPFRPTKDRTRKTLLYVGSTVVGARYYNPEGKLICDSPIKDMKIHGKEREWFSNGVLKYEGNYLDGLKDGVFYQYNSEGKLLGTFEIKNGTGIELYWHDNGQLAQEIEYTKGVVTGRKRSWSSGGKLLEEELYNTHGRKEGASSRYYPNGKLEQTLQYFDIHDFCIVRRWNELGEPEAGTPYVFFNGQRLDKEAYGYLLKKVNALPSENDVFNN